MKVRSITLSITTLLTLLALLAPSQGLQAGASRDDPRNRDRQSVYQQNQQQYNNTNWAGSGSPYYYQSGYYYYGQPQEQPPGTGQWYNGNPNSSYQDW